MLPTVSSARELSDQLRDAFPVEPIESQFFAPGVSLDSGDISGELYSRLYGREWIEVTMDDWANIGGPGSLPHLLLPRAVHYYVPSLLASTLTDLGYLDWGAEALLPNNQKREPREWWKAYFPLFDENQKSAVRDYLLFAKNSAVAGSALEYLASLALSEFWVRK